MKMRIASLLLLTVCCLMLAVAPAMADTLYSNGPYNGTTDAWTINSGFSVSNGFTVPSGTVMTAFHIVLWLVPGDNPDVMTVDAAVGSTPFGGTAQTTDHPITSYSLGTNQYGYGLYGVYFGCFWCDPIYVYNYLTLSNAQLGGGNQDPVYWDENSGPSLAYENTLGSIPSEAFTILGTASTTPEPSSIMLFASGILGLAGVLRRKLTR